MRRLLHGFYHPVAPDILKNTLSAMGPDSLIISDMLPPPRVEVGDSLLIDRADLDMMTIGGQERSLSDLKL
ncbi:Uncharacterized protein TPAR_07611 [Tolypocladium paradoxum]|uniref:Uncharacterized protein n=1 Tax=Tolypocladium paradoxum TaxID=94208 RepID=A0A2S4KPR4_9HYPO|nr:Uncharacterized protein TPAR_07611 [Tolypocladium paradoxum]